MVITNDSLIVMCLCPCLKARDVNETMKKRLAEMQMQANSLMATSSQMKTKASDLTSAVVKYCL